MSPKNTSKMRFGIVGGGLIAAFHVKALASVADAVLVGVTDARPEGAARFAATHGCRAFSSLDDMLSCSDIDTVNICTPSGSHAEIAVAAANAGKHIIIEKPMAITDRQAQEIIDAVERNSVTAAVVTQFRFTDAVTRVKRAIDSGALGDILLANLIMKYYRSKEYYASAAWRGTWAMDGGGALMNQGIHGIDVIQYLLGGVKSVLADCRTQARDIEVEDAASMLVEYRCGAVGVIQCATCVYPGYPRNLEITGTKGTVAISEDAIVRWDIVGAEREACVDVGLQSNASSHAANISAECHARQFQDFVDAVRNNRRPLVDVHEGKKPLDIILAAYESSRFGKRIEIQ